MIPLPELTPLRAITAALLFPPTNITRLSLSKPNPDRPQVTAIDRRRSALFDFILNVSQWIIPMLGLYHAILILYYEPNDPSAPQINNNTTSFNPNPNSNANSSAIFQAALTSTATLITTNQQQTPSSGSPSTHNIPPLLCPHPENLAPWLFTPNKHLLLSLLLLSLSGEVRIQSFHALGPDFVFQHVRPRRLVTTGPYKHVRHPSVLAGVVNWLALHATLARLDGVLGCWVPGRLGFLAGYAGLVALGLDLVFVGVFVRAVPPRVRDEERFLKREFGSEWEEWRGRTKLYVPFLY